MVVIQPDDIRSKAVPLYQLLTIGRRDRSGDFCPGARLTRDQAIVVIGVTLAIRIHFEGNGALRTAITDLSEMDAAALHWIVQHMPADGSATQ